MHDLLKDGLQSGNDQCNQEAEKDDVDWPEIPIIHEHNPTFCRLALADFGVSLAPLHGSLITPEFGDDRESWNTVRREMKKLDRHNAVFFG